MFSPSPPSPSRAYKRTAKGLKITLEKPFEDAGVFPHPPSLPLSLPAIALSHSEHVSGGEEACGGGGGEGGRGDFKDERMVVVVAAAAEGSTGAAGSEGVGRWYKEE